jgi:hypothetical protein
MNDGAVLVEGSTQIGAKPDQRSALLMYQQDAIRMPRPRDPELDQGVAKVPGEFLFSSISNSSR